MIIEGTVQIVPYMDLCHKIEGLRGFGFVIGRLVPGKYSDLIYVHGPFGSVILFPILILIVSRCYLPDRSYLLDG